MSRAHALRTGVALSMSDEGARFVETIRSACPIPALPHEAAAQYSRDEHTALLIGWLDGRVRGQSALVPLA
jgi:hypothetical protein